MENIYKAQRFEKAQKLLTQNINPYANDIQPTHLASVVFHQFEKHEGPALELLAQTVSVAGRIIFMRSFGKVQFIKLRDRSGEIQIFIERGKMTPPSDVVAEHLDMGDIILAHGVLFRTKTNELTVRVKNLVFVTKAIEQPPEKWHGLTDIEARYRKRYADMIANPQVKDVFVIRAKIIKCLRAFLDENDFLEVETPMMHPIPGGAKARPFVTHHNTLDCDLYLRIAPELYLKRLVVGGFERVYEINRNFRNEGMSVQHNPEFTMLEFYMSYATFEDQMDFTEKMLAKVAKAITGSGKVTYQERELDFTSPFRRVALKPLVLEFLNLRADNQNLLTTVAQYVANKKYLKPQVLESASLDLLLFVIFENEVEKTLIQPTFVTHYPTVVSPLSRKNEINPLVSDRFELFIAGREIANAFSELNDPVDQRERFMAQVKERAEGDDEAMYLDEDYIHALEYGMPPTAGCGIGIDRLVMLLTNSASIRDVILFPTLRTSD